MNRKLLARRPGAARAGRRGLVALIASLLAMGTSAPLASAASSGPVFAWGANGNGELGNGTTGGQSNTPAQVSGLPWATAVAAGGMHSLALLPDGTIRAWGSNHCEELTFGPCGQLGDATYNDSNTPVGVQNLAGVTGIAAGYAHSLALTSGGTVYAWGSNLDGQLGDGTYADSNLPVQARVYQATAIAAGPRSSLALESDGEVVQWGENTPQLVGGWTDSNTPQLVYGLSNAVAIAAGGDNLALLKDGTVMEWNQYSGQHPTRVYGLSGVRAIAAGSNFNLALRWDGTVLAWGSNQCWGYSRYSVPCGQLGNGTPADSDIPAPVIGLGGATAIAAGEYTGYALKADGVIMSWGNNREGELGNGSSTPYTTIAAPVAQWGIPAQAIGAGPAASTALAVAGWKTPW